MLEISTSELLERLSQDNRWWTTGQIDPGIDRMTRRAYFPSLDQLFRIPDLRRAIVLMGPRRVGKTILIQHVIAGLLQSGARPSQIFYAALDTPLLAGLSLERLIGLARQRDPAERGPFFVFFDEVQYLDQWETQLKVVVDSQRDLRILVSGSAAGTLLQKSRESGAGRFTDFILPPLTFDEYLTFTGEGDLAPGDLREAAGRILFQAPDGTAWPGIDALNQAFEDYLNFGGFPETALSAIARERSRQFVAADIIEKTLLKDLPSLYGISNVRELNRLFNVLAYNTAQEVSLEGLAQSSGLSKNTIGRYLDYLEAAFLIRRIERIDQTARRFERARTFKVYLPNPTLRAALFGPMSREDDRFGHMAETAIFAQWFHQDASDLHYARWKDGEVDIVRLAPSDQKPRLAVEVKWSDRILDRPGELAGLADLIGRYRTGLEAAIVTTRSRLARRPIGGMQVDVLPTALYCLDLGRQIVAKATRETDLAGLTDQPSLPFLGP